MQRVTSNLGRGGATSSSPSFCHVKLLKASVNRSIIQRQPSSVCQAACRLAGVGSSVPETVITNADLASLVDTNDEWISTRTGIRRRHVLAEGETLGSHAVKAATRALEMAQLNAEDLNMIIFCTSSPDDLFGGACQVRNACLKILRWYVEDGQLRAMHESMFVDTAH